MKTSLILKIDSLRTMLLGFIAIILFSYNARAQTKHIAMTFHSSEKARPTYLKLGLGGDYFNLRDFATSPLFYQGTSGSLAIGHYIANIKHETNITLKVSLGAGTTESGNHLTSNNLIRSDLEYSRLWQIKGFLKAPWNFKAGGTINMTLNQRSNGNFFNNSSGMEGVGTLFASAKLSRDVSRKKAKTLNWGFIQITFLPRKRQLSYQLNPALINSSYRNGYAYLDQSGIINESEHFANHQFDLISGYRLSSSLEYQIYLKNSNIIRFSYIWDAYFTKANPDRLELARHQLMLSFLFSLTEKIDSETLKNSDS